MSMQADIQSFLVSMADGATDKDVRITPEQVALQTGVSRDKVNKTLHNLMTRKRIDLLRGENGRAIIGYRLLEPPPDGRRRAHTNGSSRPSVPRAPRAATETTEKAAPAVRRRRLVYTPLTDAYEESKVRYSIFVETLGDRIESSFKEDPQAEEAILLKERLALVEEQVHELRVANEELERDVRSLRTRHMRAVEQKASEAGAVLVHGD